MAVKIVKVTRKPRGRDRKTKTPPKEEENLSLTERVLTNMMDMTDNELFVSFSIAVFVTFFCCVMLIGSGLNLIRGHSPSGDIKPAVQPLRPRPQLQGIEDAKPKAFDTPKHLIPEKVPGPAVPAISDTNEPGPGQPQPPSPKGYELYREDSRKTDKTADGKILPKRNCDWAMPIE